MQGSTARFLILGVVLSLGTLGFSAAATPTMPAPARWPSDERLFAVDGWSSGPAVVERFNGTQFVTRHYARSDSVVRLVVSTNTTAKGIYRAGPEVPFLGSGYSVAPLPRDLVSSKSVPGALAVQKADQAYLLLSAYGERRGLLGNGPIAWGLVALDAVLGRPNDYYLMSVLAPLDSANTSGTAEVIQLADALFPRVAAWYAA
jgi:hypothetical protein